MRVIGVRCSNKEYSAAVLEGTKASPSLVETKTVAYPKGFAKPQSLRWLLQEVDALLAKHSIERVVIKAFEGMARGKPFEERVEHEAAVIIAAANRGLKAVFKKVKSTIAKDLGKKGRARYLASLDTTPFPDFDKQTEKIQEAIVAAWSELP